MKHLLEKLESAEEGSRELDGLIALHMEIWGADIPHYTTSLDAALTLVPEGASASVAQHGNGRGSAEIWAYVSQKYALFAVKMVVGGEIRVGKSAPIKWRKGQLLVFKDRRPIGTMTRKELAKAESAACNLPDNIIHHQNIGAATPALALCIAALRAREASAIDS